MPFVAVTRKWMKRTGLRIILGQVEVMMTIEEVTPSLPRPHELCMSAALASVVTLTL